MEARRVKTARLDSRQPDPKGNAQTHVCVCRYDIISKVRITVKVKYSLLEELTHGVVSLLGCLCIRGEGNSKVNVIRL